VFTVRRNAAFIPVLFYAALPTKFHAVQIGNRHYQCALVAILILELCHASLCLVGPSELAGLSWLNSFACLAGFGCTRITLAFVFSEQFFAHSNRLRSDLYQFIIVDEFQGLLQTHFYLRGQHYVFIGASGAHVC